jgi:hypothetical protein
VKAETRRLFEYVNKQVVLDWSLYVQFPYNLISSTTGWIIFGKYNISVPFLQRKQSFASRAQTV